MLKDWTNPREINNGRKKHNYLKTIDYASINMTKNELNF